MVWQDFVLTAGSIIFIIALIPTVLSKDKPPFSTSLITAIILAIFVFVYITLSLWFTSITTAVVCVIWAILATQKYKSIKKW